MDLDFNILNFKFSRENGVSVETDGDKEFISLFARIKRVLIDCKDNSLKYELEFLHRYLKQLKTVIVPASTLTPSNLMNLMAEGLDVKHTNKDKLCSALLVSGDVAEVEYIHTGYGFDTFKDQTIFVSNRIHSKKALDEKVHVNHSRYDIEPRGTISEWLDMYVNHIHGSAELEMATIMGLSAPILAYLKQFQPDLRSLLIHLTGSSSSGKTTALQIACSVAGNPSSEAKSLVRNWNGTLNSILASCQDIHGIPLAFDELSTNSYQNLTGVLYNLTDGVGRARANSEGNLRPVGSWSTVFLSSGELSIYNRVSSNVGLRVRIFEFENLQWTKSASQAEAIKTLCSQNFGHLLPAFMDHLFSADVSLGIISDYYEEQVDNLMNLLPDSTTKQRVASKLAIILTTAELVNSSGLITVDTEAITQILIDYEESHIDDRDLGANALDKLMQHLIVNQRALSKYGHNTLGYLEGKNVFIYREQLAKLLKQLGFEDSKLVINQWIASGDILQTESDRNTSRVVIDGKRHISYKIRIPKDYVRAGLQEVPSRYNTDKLLNSKKPTIDTQERFDLDDSDIDF